MTNVGRWRTRLGEGTGVPFIRHTHEVAGAAENVRNVHFADEAHEFSRSKRTLVLAFFAKLRAANNAPLAEFLCCPEDSSATCSASGTVRLPCVDRERINELEYEKVFGFVRLCD